MAGATHGGMRRETCVLASILAAALGCGGGKASPVDAGATDAPGDPDAPDAPDVPGAGDAPAGSDAVDAPPVVPLEHVTSVFPPRDGTARVYGRAAAPVLRHATGDRRRGLGAGLQRGRPDDAGRQL